MLKSISGYNSNRPTFKQNLHPIDLKYKQAIIKGIQKSYQFTPKVENLNSIVGPYKFREILKRLLAKNFSLGKVQFGKEANIKDFENITNGIHCANLHIHTNNSDGSLNIENYLEQARNYGDKLAKLNNKESLPYYVSSITDHNNFDGVREVIAQIVDEPKKYKNLKFIPGCEFMFNYENSGFKFSAFEALGYCFNPFDKEISEKVSKFNSIQLINKIKEFGGILSYAHPIRFCQGNGLDPKFIEYLKRIGIDGIESNYQYITFKKDKEVLDMIDNAKKVAKENNFWQTGGTDSHAGNIFCFKAGEFLDKLI